MNKKSEQKNIDGDDEKYEKTDVSPDAAATPEPRMIEVDEKEYQVLQQQVKEQKDKYIRLLAEFENMRKRQDRERAEFVRYANEALMVDFLSIVDDLERTVAAAREKHEDYDAFLKGVEMVMGRVHILLKKQGVEKLDPVGKPFDPYAHEILAQEPTAAHPDGTVMEAFQKGYRIGDKVIRTAKVKVATRPMDPKGTESETECEEGPQQVE